ncbi:hypothetical protein HHK36_025872 [Tetracentron sinense]|uniref:Uncharacterized protein n=1 Tax=Tetracentron sinense TaxID=13715 RepID=A0A835D6T9_TETSI|nr:hypothetical protein HHK36_025872 [Tetracentron sinense]
MTLLVGDSHREACSRIKARKPERTQVLVLRREHVFGNRFYTTKARFGGRSRDISIDCSVGDDSMLCFSIDGKRVLQIKQLQWKFRGNERIEVDGVPIQVSWDVYSWLFEDVDDGHAVFMFRFEKMGFEDENEVNEKNGMVFWPQNSCGFGMNGFERKKIKKSLLKTRSSSSSSISSASSGRSSTVMEWASMEEDKLQNPSGFSLLVSRITLPHLSLSLPWSAGFSEFSLELSSNITTVAAPVQQPHRSRFTGNKRVALFLKFPFKSIPSSPYRYQLTATQPAVGPALEPPFLLGSDLRRGENSSPTHTSVIPNGHVTIISSSSNSSPVVPAPP